MGNKVKNGFKFLTPYGATTRRDINGRENGETIYPLPRPDEKWGPWFEHPKPTEDGESCGSGRWHVMRSISAVYAPSDWWLWYVQAENIIGESDEKFSCTRLRLRRISRKVFWRMIRLGWCKGANLLNADLSGVDLREANIDNTISMEK